MHKNIGLLIRQFLLEAPLGSGPETTPMDSYDTQIMNLK